MEAMPHRVELLVPATAAGGRLDAWLSAELHVPRARAAALAQAGAVLVDGRRAAKSTRLRGGERIAVEEASPDQQQVVPPPLPEVVWEDEHVLVVDKPPGLVVHPAPGHRGQTLVELLGHGEGASFEPRAVHRLDRDTSGLMLVAKGEPAQRQLQAVLRRREVEREYLALAGGRLESRTGTIDAPIGRDPRRRTRMSTTTDKPREARTHFEVEELLEKFTLVRVRLETGRTHQIRAHMAAIGHPICGDPQYGGAKCGRRLGLTRQFLHAAKLRFRHPVGGADTCCESKPPADLQETQLAATREPVSGGPDGG
jgi:23S rRNA pseudouridine1911/1915/1917 synthase